MSQNQSLESSKGVSDLEAKLEQDYLDNLSK